MWQFSQPPSEHIFPVPNVSQNVALQVRVQSLPRQPTYPNLTCSIHTGLPSLYSKTPSLNSNLSSHDGLPTFKKSLDPSNDSPLQNSNVYGSNSVSSFLFNSLPIPNFPINNIPINSLPKNAVPPPYGKKCHNPGEDHWQQNGELPQVSVPQHQGSPLLHTSSHSPTPSRTHSPSPLPTSKTAKWLYSAVNGSADPSQVEDYGSSTNGTERSKGPIPESLRALKNFSLTEPPRCPSPRSAATETNPLIGSLLQERQEVIARIAQRLNFCDPTAPPLPLGLFASDNPPKAMWGSNHDDVTANKTKESEVPTCESVGHVWPSPFNTSIADTSFSEWRSSSPKPAVCRKLKMVESGGEIDTNGEREREIEKETDHERGRDSSLITQAVQDITRLIQERLSVPSLSPRHSRSSSPLHQTHTTTVTHTVRTYLHVTPTPQGCSNTATNGYANGYTPSHEPHRGSTQVSVTHPPICTDKPRVDPGTERHFPLAQNGAHYTLEEPLLKGQSHPQTGQCLQIHPQDSFRTASSHEAPSAFPDPENSPVNAQTSTWTCNDSSTAMNCNISHNHNKPQLQYQSQTQICATSQASSLQDENQAPLESRCSSSPDTTPPSTVLVRNSSLCPYNFV